MYVCMYVCMYSNYDFWNHINFLCCILIGTLIITASVAIEVEIDTIEALIVLTV